MKCSLPALLSLPILAASLVCKAACAGGKWRRGSSIGPAGCRPGGRQPGAWRGQPADCSSAPSSVTRLASHPSTANGPALESRRAAGRRPGSRRQPASGRRAQWTVHSSTTGPAGGSAKSAACGARPRPAHSTPWRRTGSPGVCTLAQETRTVWPPGRPARPPIVPRCPRIPWHALQGAGGRTAGALSDVNLLLASAVTAAAAPPALQRQGPSAVESVWPTARGQRHVLAAGQGRRAPVSPGSSRCSLPTDWPASSRSATAPSSGFTRTCSIVRPCPGSTCIACGPP